MYITKRLFRLTIHALSHVGKGVPPYGKAFSGRQESPFRIAVKVIMRHGKAYMTVSQCIIQSAENPRISHESCSVLSPDDSQRVQAT